MGICNGMVVSDNRWGYGTDFSWLKNGKRLGWICREKSLQNALCASHQVILIS